MLHYMRKRDDSNENAHAKVLQITCKASAGGGPSSQTSQSSMTAMSAKCKLRPADASWLLGRNKSSRKNLQYAATVFLFLQRHGTIILFRQ